MSSAIEFTATIDNGALVPPMHYKPFMKANAGKQARVSLSWNTKKRSLRQNSFWFGPVLSAVRNWMHEQGYNFSAEETHDYLVRHVWKHTEVVMVENTPYERRLSSTKLSTADWEKMIDITRLWASERGFIVPFPNEEGL